MSGKKIIDGLTNAETRPIEQRGSESTPKLTKDNHLSVPRGPVEMCRPCNGTGRHEGRFGMNDALCQACGGSGSQDERLYVFGVAPARFYLDHGMIHDRVTGKHVVTDGTPPFEDSIEQVCDLLNSLANAETRTPSSSECQPPAVFADPNNSAPEGDFVLVPRIANTDMIGVWRTSQAQGDSLETSYCKMIAAAPNPPRSTQ